MRIHSDVIGYKDIVSATEYAARNAGHGKVILDDFDWHGSTKRKNGITVKLIGDGTHSKRRVNAGTAKNVDRYSLDYAATYDSWGFFLAYLFALDADMLTPYDKGSDDFLSRTSSGYPLPIDEARARHAVAAL